MSKQRYELEVLLDTFKEHSEKYDKEYMEQQERHLREYGENLPYENFNVAEALFCMCKEINEIKNKLRI